MTKKKKLETIHLVMGHITITRSSLFRICKSTEIKQKGEFEFVFHYNLADDFTV